MNRDNQSQDLVLGASRETTDLIKAQNMNGERDLEGLTALVTGANGGLGFPDGRCPGPGLRRPGPFHELRHARRRGENGIP